MVIFGKATRTHKEKFNHWLKQDKRIPLKLSIFGMCMLGVGVGLGVLISRAFFDVSHQSLENSQLRLPGQKFTSPLLACNRVLMPNSPTLSKVQTEVEQIIADAKTAGTISSASVYVRLLQSSEEFLINQEEHFFPASLRKLPLMMQYLREAETTPEILTTKKRLDASSSANLGTIIPPKISPMPNKEYSALELIELMIKHSDNVSFQVLYAALGEARFRRIYAAMQLEYPENFVDLEDHRTPMDYALFFRTLYNATYLNLENSEKALTLLTQTDYTNGLVRFLPPQLPVAHKFGVATLQDETGKQYGELHDCGIVYKPNNPYVLCIMTKSYSPQISAVEAVIANISASVYESLEL